MTAVRYSGNSPQYFSPTHRTDNGRSNFFPHELLKPIRPLEMLNIKVDPTKCMKTKGRGDKMPENFRVFARIVWILQKFDRI
jgi:hypothetical protein